MPHWKPAEIPGNNTRQGMMMCQEDGLPKKKYGNSSEYDPKYCDLVMEIGSQGKSICSMGAAIGVASKTIYNWAEVHPEFKDALEEAKALQKAFFENLSLDNFDNRNFNVGLFTLASRNMIGWRGKDEQPTIINVGAIPGLDAIKESARKELEEKGK